MMTETAGEWDGALDTVFALFILHDHAAVTASPVPISFKIRATEPYLPFAVQAC
ncbi:hypothetical protein HY3_04055 [Hyphomonas pacifica]|uniref:Uncharacterized protein n=1 Tax=Hyphomonas pacifica TaxID=1280941 RepID=A0A062TZZ9_9PROT|nr:hypothetical protein HY2_04360 [Hyphomonas pacifica]RAN31267.1 hypothetical protein HY3_04055 [Hyphomonas pacifica]RAN38327.1 hypothetical protein HY11_00520 [Hyphomonas pacifica]